MNTLRVFLPILLLTLIFIIPTPVYALDCDLDTSAATGAPEPIQIICPFIRIINFLVIAAGVAFLVYVAYGAIKLAVSLGDPKGLQGAQKTWTYAGIGFLIILFAFGIVYILNATFGFGTDYLSRGSPTTLYEIIQHQLQRILCYFWIFSGDGACEAVLSE